MSKTYTQEEFDKALSKGIAAATGRREEQFQRRLKDLGFDSVEQVKELRTNYDNVVGERDTLVKNNEISEKRSNLQTLGVDERFTDFVLKDANDKDINEYLKENPQYLKENFARQGSDGGYNGGSKGTLETAQSDEEYLKLRREDK